MIAHHLLHGLIDAGAAATPAAPALASKRRAVTYAELAAEQDAFSAAAAAYLPRGARIAILAPKSIEFVAAAFGATKAGMIFVPVNPALKPGQVGHILRDCGVELLVTTADALGLLADELLACPTVRAAVVIGPAMVAATVLPTTGWSDFVVDGSYAGVAQTADDVATILYTSGSTGRPKGVVVPHRSLVGGAHAVAAYLEHRADDRILAAMPLSFDAGFSQLTTAFAAGASAFLLDYLLPAEVVRTVVERGITGLCGVPPFWMQMTATGWPADCPLRYIATTGGRMPRETVDRLRTLIPGVKPFLMYGLTEAFRSTYLPPDEIDRRPGSIGRAIPGQEIRVLRPDGSDCAPGERGELIHRGSTVCLGYWNNPAATAERYRRVPHVCGGVVVDELVVFSGDEVTIDADGYVYFVGRSDEMIKSSGYRISPVEIEEAVYSTGLVAQAVAYGIDDTILGHRIGLVVHAPTLADSGALIAACRKLLPVYMVPATITVAATPLPVNPNGKIDRKLALAMLAAPLAVAA